MNNTVEVNNFTIFLSRGTVYEIGELAEGAIALDGAVRGPIMGTPENGDRWSFDHHDNCVRLITEATCQQVYRALKLGFDPTGRTAYINDLDGDTLMSLFLLLAWDGSPEVQELVDGVGILDAHGPAGYVFMSDAQRRLVDNYYAGVIHPLVGPRAGGSQELFGEWGTLIERGMGLIQQLLDGDLPIAATPVEPVEIIYSNEEAKMVMAKCSGFGGFTTLYRQGYTVVVLTSDAPEGTHRYTVGKLSDLVPYALGPTGEGLLGRLQKAEEKAHPETGGWGGGSSIGGSPRNSDGSSSRLPHHVVWELV